MKVYSTVHCHSSVPNLAPHLNQFLPTPTIERGQANLKITLIWKEGNLWDKGGGGRMCHFLIPLKLTQELSQKMSYSSEFLYGSCFYDVY